MGTTRSNLRAILVAAACAGVSACTVGPDFVRPETKSPPVWQDLRTGNQSDSRAVEPGSKPVSAPIEAQWWRQFNDPELNSLEARVAGNLDIQTAMARLVASRARRSQAVGARWPTASAEAAYIRQRTSQEGNTRHTIEVIRPPGDLDDIVHRLGEPYDLYQPGFDVSWELDLWGAERRTVESANAAVAQSTAGLLDVQLTIRAELARDYLQWCDIQRQLEIAREDVAASEQMLQLIDRRAEGGLVTDFEVASQRARLAEGRASVVQLNERRKEALNSLALILGDMPGALEKDLDGVRAIPTVPSTVPVGISSEVARRRPDIRAAEARLHAATAEIGIAVADLYPHIVLTGSFGTQALRAADVTDWAARQWSLGPSLSLPLFDGGRRRATVELRKAEQQEAAVSYQRTVLRAWHEIDDALSGYAAEQLRNAELAESVRSSRAALEVANTRYEHGLTNFLSALDAQRTLLQAQREYADSSTTIATRLVALDKALGGGWDKDNQPDGRPMGPPGPH
jgi:NodT family efflux transporter outer membrane factor (OMF) lipoprotein